MPGPKHMGNRLTVALVGGGVSLLALFALLALERIPVGRVVGAVRGHSEAPATTDIIATALAIGIPIALGCAVAFVLAVLIRGLRVIIYVRGVRAYTGQYLQRHATLSRLGISPGLMRFDTDGQPLSDEIEPLPRLAAAYQRLLLLGDAGAGKTVALHELAHRMTRRRDLPRLLLGRSPLPLLVSLPGYSQSAAYRSGELRFDYLAAQVARFGTRGFARRAAQAVHRGQFMLLCDGLDEVATSERSSICAELATLGAPAHPSGRVVIACGLRAYSRAPQAFAPLKRFQRVALAETTPADATAAIRRTLGLSPKRKASAPQPRAYRLDQAMAQPALLAALLAVVGDGQELPYGRGSLLLAYITLMCRQSAGGENSAEANTLSVLLSALASSLRQAASHAVPLDSSASVGAAVAAWLTTHEPSTASDHHSAMLSAYSAAEAETLCRAAIRGGMLVVRGDGQALQFAHHLLEDAFAAAWLFQDDDGLGRLHAELLRPRWALPVILWSDLNKDPADVAKRLLRLAGTPDSTAARAGLASRASVYPAALALSVAAAAESFANTLAQPPISQLTATRALDMAQQHLRDLLDQLSIYTADPDQQARLARALQQVEEAAGPEMATSIAYLAKQSGLNRLVRAQLIGVLGLLASPPALVALTDFLAEMDPVIRQSTDSAFHLAGVAALAPLQAALAGDVDTVRRRASDVLAGLGDIAVENAVAGLDSATADERVASARALGLLRAPVAIEPLITRLEDSESAVAVAAARALGAIGGAQAREALTSHMRASDPAVRAAIAAALGQARDGTTVPALILFLDDAEPEVRTAAATALGRLSDSRAIAPLRERRADPDPWAQHAVVGALRRLSRNSHTQARGDR